MDNNGTIKKPHVVTIAGGVTVTGVSKVVAVEEKEVVLAVGSRTLTLTGSDFSAEKLSIEEGVIVIKGEVVSLKYSSAADAKGFLKKLFK